MKELRDKVNRLWEIQEEMLGLLGEARELLRGTRAYDRADAYWLAHIRVALGSGHGYLDRSMCSMEDTISELEEEAEGAEEEF